MAGNAKIYLVHFNQLTTDPSRPQGYLKGPENSCKFVANLALLASTWFSLLSSIIIIIRIVILIVMNNVNSFTVLLNSDFL
jgi:hypothetical protein